MNYIKEFLATNSGFFNANGVIKSGAPSDIKTAYYNLQIKKLGVVLVNAIEGSTQKQMHRCVFEYCNHSFNAIPKEFKRRSTGCPMCLAKTKSAQQQLLKVEKVKDVSKKEKNNSIESRNRQIAEYYDTNYPVSPQDIIDALELSITAGTVKSIINKGRKLGLTSNADQKKKEEEDLLKECSKIGIITNGADYVVIDTETTGLGYIDEVIEIAVISSFGDVLMDTLVKPTCEISGRAQSVHGIGKRQLKKAPTWQDISEQFSLVTEGKLCVAYNAKFDSRLIEQSLNSVGMTSPLRKWVCAMEAYSHVHRLKRWAKLVEAAERYDITSFGAHRAMADSRMALEVFKRVDGKKPGSVKRANKSKKKQAKSNVSGSGMMLKLVTAATLIYLIIHAFSQA
jgi:DNA polymerase III epsilon subunit-like protein